MKRQKTGVIGWLCHYDNEYGFTAAACDIKPEKIARFKTEHPHVAAYTDYRKMAGEAGLDAVIISSPNWLHREMTECFLRRGINVFVEKPMGINREEIDSIVRAQKKSGKICAVDFELRISVGFRRLKEIIDSGEIGRPVAIEFVHHRGGWLAQGNNVWRTVPGQSGGIFLMEICHEIDLFRWLFGEISSVQSFRHHNVLPQYPENMPDNVCTHLWFAGGQTATILVSHVASVYNAPAEKYDDLGHDMYFIFTGSEGCIRFEYIKHKILICRYAEFHPDAERGKRVELKRVEDYATVDNFTHDITGNHIEFLKSCALAQPFHQEITDAWKSHVVCLAAEKSAVENFQKIEIDYTLI